MIQFINTVGGYGLYGLWVRRRVYLRKKEVTNTALRQLTPTRPGNGIEFPYKAGGMAMTSLQC